MINMEGEIKERKNIQIAVRPNECDESVAEHQVGKDAWRLTDKVGMEAP